MAHLVRQTPPILPDAPIDVAGWKEDDDYEPYPEGARAKSAYFPPQGISLPFINPSRRYLFKRSEDRYPVQFWSEIAAYHVGCLLDVRVPPALPAINSYQGHCGALIEWFYEDGKALWVPGGSYMQKQIKGFDPKRGKLHNFHSVRVVFRALQIDGRMSPAWMEDWTRVLLFDALCGNTDRHQDNWGVVFDQEKAPPSALLSPAYDNGTSLGYQLSEESAGGWHKDDFLRFICRGRHHIRWSLTDTAKLGHIELISRLADAGLANRDTMLSLLNGFELNILRENLEKLSALPMPIALTAWRTGLICTLVETRQNLLIEALQ